MSPTVVAFFAGGTLAELYALMGLSSQIGILNTFSEIMFTFLIGVFMSRSWGGEFFNTVSFRLRERKMPSGDEIHGSVMAAAAMLFITPGFLTDLAATLIVIPPTGRLVKKWVTGRVEKCIAVGQNYFLFKG